jgi:hypothetical protein
VSGPETIAIVRDLFLIVAAGVFVVLFIPAAILYFRLLRSLDRTARNLENISSTVLNDVVRPLSSLTGLVELVNRIVGLVLQRRSPERSGDDGTE